MARILIVDDEKSQNVTMRLLLEGEGHQVVDAPGGAEALAALARESFDLVLTDLRMSPVDGLAVIEGARREAPGTPVIMLTAYADLDTAVEAMRRGAVNYLRKPWKMEEVKLAVARALEGAAIARERPRLAPRSAARRPGPPACSGAARRWRACATWWSRIAPSDATVLIRGESGSGKEVAARAIHEASARAAGPFVAVNCAAIPENLLESELFGYRRGAFTGADEDREGLFEAARGGTLLLDEIGESGPGVQAKLLRVLAEAAHQPRRRPARARGGRARPGGDEPAAGGRRSAPAASARTSTTGCW